MGKIIPPVFLAFVVFMDQMIKHFLWKSKTKNTVIRILKYVKYVKLVLCTCFIMDATPTSQNRIGFETLVIVMIP